MKKLVGLLAVATIIMIAVISCSKGATGPAGPVGPAGPDSVVYSSWISLAFKYNTVNKEYEDTLTAPSVTKRILDSGIILTYVNFPETNGVYHVVAVSSLSSVFLEDYTIGKINIIASSDYSGMPYRYVTIPGSMKTGNGASIKVGGYTISELKAMSYEQVQQVLADINN